MKEYALRMLAWFTINHIQWLVVQCLNDKGLHFALYRVVMRLADKDWQDMKLGDVLKELNRD